MEMPTVEAPRPKVEYKELKPEYQFNSFDILYLSDNAEGMHVKTRDYPNRPHAKSVLLKHGLLKKEGEKSDRKDVADIIQGDVAKAITDTLKNAPTSAEMQIALDTLGQMGLKQDQLATFQSGVVEAKAASHKLGSKEEHTDFMNRYAATNKVGLRNLTLKANTLEADIVRVPYAFYALIGTKEDREKGLTELANPAATAMIIKTADNKLIVQHRGLKNAQFADMPGASAAGILDDRRNQQRPGSPAILTDTRVEGNNLKEAREEVGLTPTNIFGKPHTEITKDVIEF